jgi:ubiquitin carboxyl-terminal hydrolase 8
MTGNNKFYCTNCKKERNAKTKTILFELPKYLIIHPAFNYRHANELYFEIPPSINFAPYLYSGNYSNYELIAVIFHLRSNILGHNVTFCKKNNIWYCFNDSLVSEISFEDIKTKGIPLILLYTIS